MATNELLETYLNDHLAGATAGVDLARRLAEETEGTPVGAAMHQLADDIEADRSVLESLVDRLGFEEHTVKQAAAWMAEKASRVRLSRVSAGSDALALHLSMETLSMGVDGKRSLWQSLQEIAVDVPILAALDLAALAERAESQHAVLEKYRRAAAPAALGCR
jgi:hypothetical protein